MRLKFWLVASSLALPVVAALIPLRGLIAHASEEGQASQAAAARGDHDGDGDRREPHGLMQAPAGDRVTAREVTIDGQRAAVLPNGRLITPPGVEVAVHAPKPYRPLP